MTEAAPAITGDSFFSCFQRDDLWEALAQHPATWTHVADTGFRAAIERLRQGGATQAMASEAMKDPRVMQAVAALQGWGLDVTEADIKHAESVGDVKKRDAVQMIDLQVAHAHSTVEAAKAAGNELFKAQQFSKALACYMRALELLRREAAGEAGGEAGGEATLASTVASTLSSNAAAALLKLERPKEALRYPNPNPDPDPDPDPSPSPSPSPNPNPVAAAWAMAAVARCSRSAVSGGRMSADDAPANASGAPSTRSVQPRWASVCAFADVMSVTMARTCTADGSMSSAEMSSKPSWPSAEVTARVETAGAPAAGSGKAAAYEAMSVGATPANDCGATDRKTSASAPKTACPRRQESTRCRPPRAFESAVGTTISAIAAEPF